MKQLSWCLWKKRQPSVGSRLTLEAGPAICPRSRGLLTASAVPRTSGCGWEPEGAGRASELRSPGFSPKPAGPPRWTVVASRLRPAGGRRRRTIQGVTDSRRPHSEKPDPRGRSEQGKQKSWQRSIRARSSSCSGTEKPPAGRADVVNTIYCLLSPLHVGRRSRETG